LKVEDRPAESGKSGNASGGTPRTLTTTQQPFKSTASWLTPILL